VTQVGALFTILGSGPVALACALLRARREPVRLLVSSHAPRQVPRIEVVPAQTLALLLDLGVHPHALGVHRLERERLIAWGNPQPVRLNMPAAAHVQRPVLEQALWAQVARQSAISVHALEPAAALAEARRLEDSGAWLIDATGRAAALAHTIARSRQPWVARLFHVSTPTAPAPFMAAALPDGYVYRAQGPGFATVGFVGRGAWLSGTSCEIYQRMAQGTADWLVDDLSECEWTDAGSWPAGLQWTDIGLGLAIGDAALARDALSSQGLANGLSDACHAAKLDGESSRQSLLRRMLEGRRAHINALVRMLETCHCREQPIWLQYGAFLLGKA
jgi:hypothetical protein